MVRKKALAVAAMIGARCYFETSAKTRHGLEGLMDILAQEVLVQPQPSGSLPSANWKKIRDFNTMIERRLFSEAWDALRQMDRDAGRYIPISDGKSGTSYWKLLNLGQQETQTAKGSNNLTRFFRR